MVEIALSGKKANGAVAIIDAEGEQRVREAGPWFIHPKGYATTHRRVGGKRTTLSMHRLVANIENNLDLEVDHLDNNPLNNQKINLLVGLRASKAFRRLQCLRQDHQAGQTSRFRGVCWSKRDEKWQVRMVDEHGTRRSLGYFSDEEEASVVYEQKWAEEVARLEGIVKHEVQAYFARLEQERTLMAMEDFDVGKA
jgi:hypothetical protein